MATTLFRILKFGVQTFFRNGLLSVTTTVIMVLAVLVFNGLLVFNVVAGSAIASLQDKIDISVYFKTDAPEDQILTIEKSLQSLPEVRAVEYVSQDKALEIFKDNHGDNEAVSQALAELQVNPLLASLNIKAKDPQQYSTIAGYFENASLQPLIEKVTYGENKDAIDRLAAIISTVKSVGIGLTMFLAIVAVLVTFNTIRLAIYSNREELAVMRLVGASNKFINGPYVVAGIMYGLLAACVGVIVATPLILAASPYVHAFIPDLSLAAYLKGNVPQFIFYQLLFAVALGAGSAIVAARRYLKI